MYTKPRQEWRHGNASGGGSIHDSFEEARQAMILWELDRVHQRYRMDAPPIPPSTGISTRLVTEWVPVDTEGKLL